MEKNGQHVAGTVPSPPTPTPSHPPSNRGFWNEFLSLDFVRTELSGNWGPGEESMVDYAHR